MVKKLLAVLLIVGMIAIELPPFSVPSALADGTSPLDPNQGEVPTPTVPAQTASPQQPIETQSSQEGEPSPLSHATNEDAVEKTRDQYIGFVEQLAQKESFTLDEAKAIWNLQAAFKKAVEELPIETRQSWVQSFKEILGNADGVLSSKKLKVLLHDGREVDLEHTDFVTRLYAHYKLMEKDEDGNIRLNRFVGISEGDLATIKPWDWDWYNDKHRIGSSLNIPQLMSVYSPSAHLVLAHEMVQKFSVTDINLLLRYIDGREPAVQQARAIAERIFASHGITLPEGEITMEAIWKTFHEFQALNQALAAPLLDIINNYKGEPPFKEMLRNEIQHQVVQPKYSELWVNFQRRLGLSHPLVTLPAVYVVDGKKVIVQYGERRNFTNELPYDYQTLLQYPGLANLLTREKLESFNLIPQGFYNSLTYVNLNVSNPGTGGWPSASLYFSQPTHEFQLLEVFLNLFPEVIRSNGTVDFELLRLRLLISAETEVALKEAEAMIRAGVAEMTAFGQKSAITAEDYQKMKEILLTAQKAAYEKVQPLLQGAIYQVTNEVNHRFRVAYHPLLNAFNSVLGQAKMVVVTDDGNQIVFDPRLINSNVIEMIQNAISIQMGSIRMGNWTRAQYLKMNGTDDGLFAGLLSPWEMSYLISVPSRHSPQIVSTNQNDVFDTWEIFYGFVPRIVARHKTADPDALTRILLGEIKPAIALGQSLQGVIQSFVDETTRKALAEMQGIKIQSLDDLLKMKQIFVSLMATLKEKIPTYLATLLPNESLLVQSMVNNSLWKVKVYYHQTIQSMETLSIHGVQVSLRDVFNIPGFPYSSSYDQELFVGILPGDFDGTESHGKKDDYQNFSLNSNPNSALGALSQLGRIQLAANIIKRIQTGQAPDAESNKIFVADALNVEEFRLYIKGVRKMQARSIAEAKEVVMRFREQLEGLRKEAYTIEEILALYDIVGQSQKALLEMLNRLAVKHERQDVINFVEAPITTVHQENVFRVFTSMVSTAKLVVEINGQVVTVPVKAITEALLKILRKEFGDSLGMHHLLYFFSITTEDLQGLNTLQRYLNVQVVALPKNTTFIETVAQLSELGWMQLSVLLSKRFADVKELIKSDEVHLEEFVALLSGQDRAIAYVKGRAKQIFEKRQTDLLALGGPLNLENLEKMGDSVATLRAELSQFMDEFFSGKKSGQLNELINALEEIMNGYVADLVALCTKIVANQPFVFKVNIEGEERDITFQLDEETVKGFIDFVAKYVEDHPSPDLLLVYPMPRYEEAMGRPIAVRSGGVARAEEMPASIIRPGIIYPSPDPWYVPDERFHPTKFAMIVLLTRLLVDFGEFVLRQDGAGEWRVDMDLVYEQMQLSDADRINPRLDKLREKKLVEAEAFLKKLRESNGGAIPLEKMADITAHFGKVKVEIESLLQIQSKYNSTIYQKAQKVWDEFIALYEKSLFDEPLSITIKGETFTLIARELVNKGLLLVYGDGTKVPEPLAGMLKELESFIRGGEPNSVWYRFKRINYIYPSRDYDGGYRRGNIGGPLDEKDLSTAAGKFTIGDLMRVFPGVSARRVRNLKVAERSGRLRITIRNPIEMLKALLDVRTLTGGSGIDTGGLFAASADTVSMMPATDMSTDRNWALRLDNKSIRFQTELVVKLLAKLNETIGIRSLVAEGDRIDRERFEQALRGTLDVEAVRELKRKRQFEAERAAMLAGVLAEKSELETKIEMLKHRLAQAQAGAEKDFEIFLQALAPQRRELESLVQSIRSLSADVPEMTEFLARMEDYLDENHPESLNQAVENYKAALEDQATASLSEELRVHRAYLVALGEYADRIETATEEEFLVLKDDHPIQEALDLLGTVAPSQVDPRHELQAYIQQAKDLNERYGLVSLRKELLDQIDLLIQGAQVDLQAFKKDLTRLHADKIAFLQSVEIPQQNLKALLFKLTASPKLIPDDPALTRESKVLISQISAYLKTGLNQDLQAYRDVFTVIQQTVQKNISQFEAYVTNLKNHRTLISQTPSRQELETLKASIPTAPIPILDRPSFPTSLVTTLDLYLISAKKLDRQIEDRIAHPLQIQSTNLKTQTRAFYYYSGLSLTPIQAKQKPSAYFRDARGRRRALYRRYLRWT